MRNFCEVQNRFLIKLSQVKYLPFLLLELHKAEATATRKDFDNWLRLVVLIDYAGKSLCDKLLHEKECLPRDGARLYRILEKYRDYIHYQIHKDILCPSDRIIDESKFDLTIYAVVIHLMFGSIVEYANLISNVRDMRNKVFHMKNVSTCTTKFEQMWSDASSMLAKHDFNSESLKVLRTCDLYAVREDRGILEFISVIYRMFQNKCILFKIPIFVKKEKDY